MNNTHLLKKERQEGHLEYPKALLNRKAQSRNEIEQVSLISKLSQLEIQENEPQEQEIVLRRLEKLRKRLIYLETVSSSRSKHISQMAHQLAIDELPNHEWESILLDDHYENSGNDLYTLISNALQSSQKAVLENEREEKILKDFSNVIRYSVVNHESKIKTAVFNAQNSFYLKLLKSWKILFPGQDMHCPESADDLVDSINEALKELKKDLGTSRNKIQREHSANERKHMAEIKSMQEGYNRQEIASQEEIKQLQAKISLLSLELEQLQKKNQELNSRKVDISSEYEELKAEMHIQKTESLIVKNQLAEFRNLIADEKEEFHKDQNIFQILQSVEKQYAKKIEDLGCEVTNQLSRNEELENELSTLQGEFQKTYVMHESKYADLLKQHQDLNDRFSEKEQFYHKKLSSNADNLLEEISKVEESKIQLESNYAELEIKNESFVAQIKALEDQCEDLNLQKSRDDKKIREMKYELDALSESESRGTADLQFQNARIQELETALAVAQTKTSEEAEKMEMAQNTILELYGEVQELETKLHCLSSVNIQLRHLNDHVKELEYKVSQFDLDAGNSSTLESIEKLEEGAIVIFKNETELITSEIGGFLNQPAATTPTNSLEIGHKSLLDFGTGSDRQNLLNRICELEMQTSKLSSTLAEVEKRADYLEKRNQVLEMDIEQFAVETENMRRMEKDLEKFSKKLRSKNEELENKNIVIKEMEEKLANVITELEHGLEKNEKLILEVNNLNLEKNELLETLKFAEKDYSTKQGRLMVLLKDSENLNSVYGQKEKDMALIQEKNNQLQQENSQLLAELKTAESDLIYYKDEIEKLYADIEEEKKLQIQNLNSNISILSKTDFMEKIEIITSHPGLDVKIIDQINEIMNHVSELYNYINIELTVQNMKDMNSKQIEKLTNDIEDMKARSCIIQSDYQGRIELLEDELRMSKFNYAEKCDADTQLRRKIIDLEEEASVLKNDCVELFSQVNQFEVINKLLKNKLEISGIILDQESLRIIQANSISLVNPDLEKRDSLFYKSLKRLKSGITASTLEMDCKLGIAIDPEHAVADSDPGSANTAIADSSELSYNQNETKESSLLGFISIYNPLSLRIKSTESFTYLNNAYKLLASILIFVFVPEIFFLMFAEGNRPIFWNSVIVMFTLMTSISVLARPRILTQSL